MKTFSWEIIVAGLLFLGVSIYLVNQHSESKRATVNFDSADSLVVHLPNKNLRIIHLDNLENLESLENLEKLKNLKNLANFLPAEARAEFETEIEAVINEYGEKEIQVKINPKDSTLSINEIDKVTKGGWNMVSPGVFSYVEEFGDESLINANIDLSFGSIEVKGNSDQPAKIVIKASGVVTTSSELNSKLSTASNITNNNLSFSISPKEAFEKESNIHLEAILTVPENIDVNTNTNGGHITADKITGNQNYTTGGGHIKLNNLDGKVQAKTSGGHIVLTQSKGSFDLISAGGNITTKETSGPLNMKTNGGNLQAFYPAGALSASTNAGNIELQLKDISDNISLSTGAGVISLLLGNSASAAFSLSGSSVEIDPALNFDGTNQAGKAIGVIGNKNATVHASTNYGKVILKKLKEN